MGKTHDVDNDDDGNDDVADGDVDNDVDGDDDVADGDVDNDDEECCQDGTPSVGVTLLFLAVEVEDDDDDDDDVENDDVVADGDVDKDDDDWCQGGAALARLERGGGGERRGGGANAGRIHTNNVSMLALQVL